MRTVQKLSLLALALVLVGCNEKVSPELMQGNASTPSTTVPVPPSEFYFKISNTSPVLLNYKLHKTGPGNANASCEVRNTTGLSNDIFRGNLAANDITCFFEAEELSLFHQGMKFEIGASPNTCDYVAYSPFSYYDDMPGTSSDYFTAVECTNDTTNGSHAIAEAIAQGIDISTTAGGSIGCNAMASRSIPPADRVAFSPSTEEELCRFNYKDGPQCDIGEINIRTLSVTYTPPGENPATQPAILKSEIFNRKITCGGNVGNCVKGPLEELSDYEVGLTTITEITNSVINQPTKLEYELPKLIGKHDNHRYANYRRDLASTQIDYGVNDLGATYKGSFADPTFGKIFNPSVLDKYVSNKYMDNSTMIDVDALGTHPNAVSFPGNMYRAVPLAAEPFLGLAGKVNPFYTFYCLDTAFDIKARVRMMVREWDRTFSTSSDMELISDIYKGANSKQDNPEYIEVPGEEDRYMAFNDRLDWDDRVGMERTLGPYNPTNTVWQPTAGFFNVWLFPGHK